jgi:coenzyme F420-0:L-glutamate ligase/coenzyme F420-1:gamma-L-glutamate ligase
VCQQRRRPIVQWRTDGWCAARDPSVGPRIRAGCGRRVDVAVIISDTFGRAWREGQTDIAVGIAGMQPIHSYIGQFDPHGHEFKVQAVCLADELAGAAELVKGNISRMPVGVIRGYPWEPDDSATIAPVLRDQSRDLFR